MSRICWLAPLLLDRPFPADDRHPSCHRVRSGVVLHSPEQTAGIGKGDDVEETLSWLVRYGHVAFAAGWLGGYLGLALWVVPLLERERNAALGQVTIGAARLISGVGTVTMLFGALLIWRTRGYGNLIGGEWGMIVIASIVIAVALMGIGDGALRPALQQLIDTGDGSGARRWAYAGLGLTVIAIGLMTRAVYASS